MIYYLTASVYYIFLVPVSLLPLWVLYKISDGLAWLLFRVVKYRKKVIEGGMRRSFPDKTEVEIQADTYLFYQHLSDLLVESIKNFTIKKEDALPRLHCKNPELIDAFAQQGRSIIIAAGHYNNFEFVVYAISQLIKHTPRGLYMPLANRFFDQKIAQSRSALGFQLVPKQKLKKFFEVDPSQNPVALLFAMDQAPTDPAKAHWMMFLNQETGVQFGTEKYAKNYDLPVVYGRINKEKRGVYSFEFELITANPRQEPTGMITEKMTRLLEADIVAKPAYWLWSHRRWKHPRPPQMTLNQ